MLTSLYEIKKKLKVNKLDTLVDKLLLNLEKLIVNNKFYTKFKNNHIYLCESFIENIIKFILKNKKTIIFISPQKQKELLRLFYHTDQNILYDIFKCNSYNISIFNIIMSEKITFNGLTFLELMYEKTSSIVNISQTISIRIENKNRLYYNTEKSEIYDSLINKNILNKESISNMFIYFINMESEYYNVDIFLYYYNNKNNLITKEEIKNIFDNSRKARSYDTFDKLLFTDLTSQLIDCIKLNEENENYKIIFYSIIDRIKFMIDNANKDIYDSVTNRRYEKIFNIFDRIKKIVKKSGIKLKYISDEIENLTNLLKILKGNSDIEEKRILKQIEIINGIKSLKNTYINNEKFYYIPIDEYKYEYNFINYYDYRKSL